MVRTGIPSIVTFGTVFNNTFLNTFLRKSLNSSAICSGGFPESPKEMSLSASRNSLQSIATKNSIINFLYPTNLLNSMKSNNSLLYKIREIAVLTRVQFIGTSVVAIIGALTVLTT